MTLAAHEQRTLVESGHVLPAEGATPGHIRRRF